MRRSLFVVLLVMNIIIANENMKSPGYFDAIKTEFEKANNQEWIDKNIPENDYQKYFEDCYAKFLIQKKNENFCDSDLKPFVWDFSVYAYKTDFSQKNYILEKLDYLKMQQIINNKFYDDWLSLIERVENSVKVMNNPSPNILQADLDGNVINLQKMTQKVVILDFWSTGCGPCQATRKSLIDLYNEYEHNKDFVMIGVAEDDKEMLRKYCTKYDILWSQIPLGSAYHQTLIDFGIYGTPELILLDKKGIVRYRIYPEDENLNKFIDELLAE